GFLGIQPVNLSIRERAGGLQGMRVQRIQPGPGTPAYRSGLRPGDIITEVNGKPIHDADSLVLEVGRLPVESRVELTVLRDKQKRCLTVTLGKYPVRGKKIVTNRPPAWRGIHVDYPTVLIDDGKIAGQTPGYFEDAVLVTEVKSPSPAWTAGLRPGMSISHVGSKAVHTPREFRALIAGKPGPIELRLTEEEKPVRTIPPGS
ncbi:MAG: PDZ domain-containing protein, partial [Pirellulales bacterium]|nr:PDZ domain-containing protein [Pirellulales bacterium]